MTPEVAAYIATVKDTYQLWMSNLAIRERVGIGKNRLMLYIQACYLTGYIKIIDRYYSKTNPDVDNFISKDLMDIVRDRIDRILRVPTIPATVYYGPLTFTYSGTQCIIRFKVLNGESVVIDWGNGKIVTVNGRGDTLISIVSSYTSNGTFNIKFTCEKTAVTYFDINDQHLGGDITWIVRWLSLEYLDLYDNYGLSGDLTNLYLLTALTYVDLYNTTLTTCVITNWSSLINLEYLYLRGSDATGVVTTWSAMVNLEEVYLTGTAVTGSVAGWITMTNLTIAYLDANGLSGSITGWSVLVNLEEFKIYNNSITGSVTGLSACTKMRIFDVHGMAVLTGSITNFWHCSDMVYMNMDSCTSITGSITGFQFMTDLEYLNLYGTLITGDISGFLNLIKLTELRLTDCDVTATLMAWSNLNSIIAMYLSGTGMTGDVNYIAECEDLQTIYLSGTVVSYGDLAGGKVWDKTGMLLDCSSCVWTSDEVDDCLIDLAVTPVQNCYIKIDGTNAVRTAASNAALAILLAHGNTVTVNP
jgi:hypothetical protein